ncbi:MAG TPA: cyclic nucleotide-binding domain-containing protein [Candidatus Sulfotelmatobacter sp.]|nr:cyclic nucleotide-binding domain-containing protein [Candidatus Sulfotelmatobacter sp.]
MENAANIYFVWGADDAPYGPVELSTLVDWIRDERVLPDTWIFARSAGHWQRAVHLVELLSYFNTQLVAPDLIRPVTNGLRPGMLRRIKILADLSDAQLAHLMDFMEAQMVTERTVIFKQGDSSDAMYLVMAGELRARVMNGERETILATFGPGDFFGDMALFDHGPRSADVVVNVDSQLLRISSGSFNRLTKEAPALATPFLQETARTLAARIRNDNKKLTRVAQQYSASREL